MDNQEFDKWTSSYINYQSDPNWNREDHPLFWSYEKFRDLLDEQVDPEPYWQAILEVLRRNPGEQVLSMLSAGPLEDLIDNHGPEIIDRIELEAKKNPKFRSLLSEVWESSTSEIWERIVRLREDPRWTHITKR